MIIAKNAVVAIDYAIKDTEGNLLERSDDEPLNFIQGQGDLAPGLEKALEGLEAGAEISVALDPADAFGDRDETLVRTVAVDEFETPEEISEGLVFHAEFDGELRFCTVTSVNGEDVVIDGNHPFAGRRLVFEITVKNVRDATDEELDHGHVHDEHGHHHEH